MATDDRVASEIAKFMQGLERRNPGMPEFHQAVQEVVETLMPYVLDRPIYRSEQILERLTEPDRVISFRVTWMDAAEKVRVNRAWRVQFSNAIGPYKGGLRFHPTVTESILKFLGFEQIFKNSLTGLPMGAGKGGSNFNPKGKSDTEVMRFCQSMMVELQRYIGENRDIPAGDIGVGAREIGYLFGEYKRLHNEFTGVITGKGLQYGGSMIRLEATGYGVIYFLRNMLEHAGDTLEGKSIAISGSGNVAIYAAEKALELGGKVVTLSDSSGTIHDEHGVDAEKLAFVKDLKEVRRGRIAEYAERFGCDYLEGESPWRVPCDVAIPCATENEIDHDDAEVLVKNECKAVVEGANMPCTLGAVHYFRELGIPFGPAKAANAGGVAVSGLERSQNALRMTWTREQVNRQLELLMEQIHRQCVEHGKGAGGQVDYAKGANVAGFLKVAEAMLAFGAT